MKQLPLFPDSASTMSGQTDMLYLFLCALTAFFSLLIAGLIVYFAFKYRRRRDDEVPPRIEGGLALELTWTLIPLLIVMVIFAWGAKLYVDLSRLPEDAMQIDVVGKQWMWKVQHPTGKREINELHVPRGQRIKLKMISQDVIHSFFLPAFRTKQDVLPGRYTYEWFEATRLGEYHLFCAEYCGTEHSLMGGKVIVMDPAAYAAWAAGSTDQQPMAQGGESLFVAWGCAACHGQTAPTLAGLYGRPVQLADGRTVTADDDYLRRSILDPAADVTAGYPPIMPSFRGQLSEEQINELIAYIKTLAGAHQPEAPPRPSGGADIMYGAPQSTQIQATQPTTR